MLWEGRGPGKFSGKFQQVPEALLAPRFHAVSLCPLAQLSLCPHQLRPKAWHTAPSCDVLPNTFVPLLCVEVDFTEGLRQWRELPVRQHGVEITSIHKNQTRVTPFSRSCGRPSTHQATFSRASLPHRMLFALYLITFWAHLNPSSKTRHSPHPCSGSSCLSISISTGEGTTPRL